MKLTIVLSLIYQERNCIIDRLTSNAAASRAQNWWFVPPIEYASLAMEIILILLFKDLQLISLGSYTFSLPQFFPLDFTGERF